MAGIGFNGFNGPRRWRQARDARPCGGCSARAMLASRPDPHAPFMMVVPPHTCGIGNSPRMT